MNMPLVMQGREIAAKDVELIRALRRKNPLWSRYRLSREVAKRWQWRNHRGELKDIACRSLLRKLAERNLIDLPSPRCASPNRYRHQAPSDVPHDTGDLVGNLSCLRPLRFLDVGEPQTARLFACLLDHPWVSASGGGEHGVSGGRLSWPSSFLPSVWLSCLEMCR